MAECTREEDPLKKAVTLPASSNIVAETDLDATWRALENVGRKRIEAAAAAANETNDDDEKRKLRELQERLQSCMNSLRDNIAQTTNAIPDDDYEAQFERSAHVNIAWNLYEHGNQDSSSEQEDTDYDTDTEEELFLDRDALARVKDLRDKVRQASERIGKLRLQVPKHVAQLIQSETDLVENFRNEIQTTTPTKNLLNALADTEEYTSGNTKINPDAMILPGHANNDAAIRNTMGSATNEAMQDMEESLHKLNTLLETVCVRLPDELDSFHSTMEVVDTYVKKVSNVENLNEHGEYVPSNPVEKAMFSPDGRHNCSLDSEIVVADTNCLPSPQSMFLTYLNG